MSGAGLPNPPQGPREIRIQQVWDQVWKSFSEGGVYEPHIAIAEAELSGCRSNLLSNDPAALADLQKAETLNLFQNKHFAAHLDKIESLKQFTSAAFKQTQEQASKFNEHAVKSLTLANGGVVIATLAYVQAKDVFPPGFLWVIGLCSFGYLLTILGSYLVVVMSGKLFATLLSLQMPRMSDEDRLSKNNELIVGGRKLVLVTQPFFFLSAACLIVALIIGVNSLVAERPQPKNPTTHSIDG